jgi:hypothetical protein
MTARGASTRADEDATFTGPRGPVRYWLRRAARLPVRVAIADDAVFLFSSRRSGSTLLRDAIYSQLGFDFIDQPFDRGHYHPSRRRYGPNHKNQVVASSQIPEALALLEGCLSGSTVGRSQWRWIDPDFTWSVDRWVVKILNAKAIAGPLIDHFDARPVVLLRHPLAVARSTSNYRWVDELDDFVESEEYARSWLREDFLQLVRSSIASFDRFERLVAAWVAENAAIVEQAHGKGWPVVTYEELVIRPRMTFRQLQGPLSLTDEGRFVRRVALPTRTVFDRTSPPPAGGSEASEVMRRTWRTLDGRYLRTAQSLLAAQGLDSIYEARDPLPHHLRTD